MSVDYDDVDDIAALQQEDVEVFLAHFGVKGMHWGQRKETPTGASRRTDHEAHKDANEYAKAKMFYGQGAGTRRKLIKATVESKSAKDLEYKKAFDHHLANQDLGKRASQARGERRRKDTTESIAKNTRSVHRLATGGMGNVTVAATVIVGAAGLAHKTGADKIAFKAGKEAFGTAMRSGLVTTVRAAFEAKGWK